MNNSLPNSYLFSQYNDYGLDEKKNNCDFLYKPLTTTSKFLNCISKPGFSNLPSWK